MKSKKEISNDELQKAIYDLKYIVDIAKYFDVKEGVIRYKIKKYGLDFPRSYKMSGKARKSHIINGLKLKGDGNPAKRKESRLKISKSKLDYWEQLSINERSERNKAYVTNAMREKCSLININRWKNYTNKERNRVLENFSKAQAIKNITSFSCHKSGFYLSEKGGLFYYRSSWELTIAEYLDQSHLVNSYQYETITCKFHDYEQDIYRYFKPDFIVILQNGSKILLEVKPSALISHNFVKLIGQWEWALNNSCEYAIVTEKLVKSEKLFNQLLEDVFNGKHKSDTLERCGFN